MQIHFRHAENRERWAWTEELQTLGQQEIAVLVSWSEHDPRDLLLTHLLQYLERYLSEQPKRILPRQTLRYGWTLLRFVRDDQDRSGAGTKVLLIEEMQHPFGEGNPSYIPGVARTLALLHLQHETLRRNGVTGEVVYPHRSQRALVCTCVTPETIPHLRSLRAERAWKPDVQNIGWFLSCCDQQHDHDHPDELRLIHLLHLVKGFPGLFPYLTMPVGTLLLFEESRAIVFGPGENEGQADPGSLLSYLP